MIWLMGAEVSFGACWQPPPSTSGSSAAQGCIRVRLGAERRPTFRKGLDGANLQCIRVTWRAPTFLTFLQWLISEGRRQA